METWLAVTLAVLYVIVLPGVIRAFAWMHKRFVVDKAAERARKAKADPEDIPKPMWPRLRKRIGFAFKDSRAFSIKKGGPSSGGLQNRIVSLILYLAGLVMLYASFLVDDFNMWLFFGGIATFYITFAFAVSKANEIVSVREKVISRMFEIGQNKLGLKAKNAERPYVDVRVTNWRDFVTPTNVEMTIPTKFSSDGAEGFMKQFNQIFGNETEWVPNDNPKEKTIGWDYDKGLLKLRSVPPLPMRADWDAHYIINEDIAWSFFPIGLAVQDGVELKKPDSEEFENVIGFDVAGEQAKVGEKRGVNVSQKIAVTPQIFIGGTTGGGKAMPLDTPVKVIGRARDR